MKNSMTCIYSMARACLPNKSSSMKNMSAKLTIKTEFTPMRNSENLLKSLYLDFHPVLLAKNLLSLRLTQMDPKIFMRSFTRSFGNVGLDGAA